MLVWCRTTYKEYFTYFEKDAALNRRFQRIDIEEPSIKDTIKILNGIKDHYEEFHGVHYNLDSVKEIANLADRYIKKFETLENSDKPYKLTQYQISQFNNVKIKELNLVNCRFTSQWAFCKDYVCARQLSMA